MAQRKDFVLDEGATFEKTVIIKYDGSPFDLTNYSARLQVRERHYDETPVISLTVGSGLTITEPPTLGLIEIEIAPSDLEDLGFTQGEYHLEIFTSGDGVVYRILEGYMTVSQELTK